MKKYALDLNNTKAPNNKLFCIMAFVALIVQTPIAAYYMAIVLGGPSLFWLGAFFTGFIVVIATLVESVIFALLYRIIIKEVRILPFAYCLFSIILLFTSVEAVLNISQKLVHLENAILSRGINVLSIIVQCVIFYISLKNSFEKVDYKKAIPGILILVITGVNFKLY